MQSLCRGMCTGSSMDSTQNATNGGSTGGDSSSATYKSQEASAAIASHSRPVGTIYEVEEDAAALAEARCALSQAMNTTMELPSLFYRGEAAEAAVAGSSLQPDVFFEGIIASHDDGLKSLQDQQHHPYNGETAHLTSGTMAAMRPLLSTIDPPHDDDGDGDDDDDDDYDHVKVELLKSNGDVEAHGASDPLPVTLTMSASDRNKSNGGHLNASDSITSASQASVEELVKGGDLHYNRSEGSMINGAAAQKRRSSGSLLNVGDRIHALQQLVSPFGKTDTASVLSEAIGYIKFLQDQVQVLSSPYMKPKIGSIRQAQDKSSSSNTNNTGGSVSDLRSRGLCLVPVSCTLRVASSNINIGADYWASSHHDVKYMQGSDG